MKAYIFTCIILSLLFLSCKKVEDPAPDPPPDVPKLVSSISADPVIFDSDSLLYIASHNFSFDPVRANNVVRLISQDPGRTTVDSLTLTVKSVSANQVVCKKTQYFPQFDPGFPYKAKVITGGKTYLAAENSTLLYWDRGTIPFCGNTTTMAVNNVPQLFSSPNYPANYETDLSQCWTFTSPTKVKLTFSASKFATEQGWDFVLIYDTNSLTPMAIMCTALAADRVFISTGNSMRVQFVSDQSVTYAGFEASAVATP
jgi:hypothetical protein